MVALATGVATSVFARSMHGAGGHYAVMGVTGTSNLVSMTSDETHCGTFGLACAGGDGLRWRTMWSTFGVGLTRGFGSEAGTGERYECAEEEYGCGEGFFHRCRG